jgi:hypothetical protein
MLLATEESPEVVDLNKPLYPMLAKSDATSNADDGAWAKGASTKLPKFF